MKREVRFFQKAELRLSPDGKSLTGIAAPFNSWSEDLGGFREIIRAGCFARAIAQKADVRALFNHDSSVVLGRTVSATLKLSEEPAGLRYDVELPDTQAARDLKTLIERGDISGSSFGFCCVRDQWSQLAEPMDGVMVTRELIDVDLYDVSPVTFPAYPASSVDVRSLWPDGEPDSVTEHLLIAPFTTAEQLDDIARRMKAVRLALTAR